ncbi:MAG TPA: hypothetical protein VFB98_07375, partial [Candidatus Deferrimicrobium sp.]|nr:hypothetical protein [Candidatus Deferrimicrobium sp.]
REDMSPLGFDLMFQNVTGARDLFKLFQHWSNQRGGTDAVGIDFVVLKDGGIVLVCYEELESMLSFFCPQRYRIDLTPLVTFIVASKSFPRPSAALQSLVASGTLVNVDIGAYVASPGMNVSEGYRIPGLTLHKARIPVFLENAVDPDSPAGAMLRARASSLSDVPLPSRRSAPPAFPPPSDTFAERRVRMRRLFPISLAILSGSTAAVSVKESLLRQGYRAWQVWQAECNLITSKRRSLAVGQKEGGKRLFQVDMVEFLIDQPEMVGNTDLFDGVLVEENIREQITADARELLGRYNTATEGTMTTAEVQPALARLELLGEVDDQL